MRSTCLVAVTTGVVHGVGKDYALELACGGFGLLVNDHPNADSIEKLYAA